MARPVPRIARWILRLAAGPAGDDVIADLEDEAAARASTGGLAAARRWSRRQVRASIAPLLMRRVEIAVTRLRSAPMNVWRGFGSDLTVATRRLRESPGFTVVCVLTLALGIGGNTAVFTLIDRVLVKPLPVPRPAELFRVGETDACCVNSGLQGSFSLFSYDLYQRLRDTAPQFRHLAAFQANTRAVTIGHPTGDAPPETVNGAFVSGNYFELFEVAPAAGRLIQPGDDVRGAAPAVVLSYRAWTDRFHSDPGVVGSAVTLNGVAATIVGVTAPGFYGDTLRPNPAEVWMPLATEPALQPAARLIDAKPSHWLYLLGRLDRGTSVAPIEAALTATLRDWLATVPELPTRMRPEIPQQFIRVIPAPSGVSSVRDGVAPSLRLLQALATAVLLIACANLASLLLARGAARRTETAVRVALGASRLRLIGQFVLEATLLACLGGAAGLLVSFAGARAIVNLAFRGASEIPVDPSPSMLTIGFAFAVSLIAGGLVGLAPAVIGSRTDPADALRGASRTTGDRGGRLRGSLIALQVAMSVVLITCAGLLGRSLQKLEAQDFGVAIDGRYVVALAPSITTVGPAELPAMYARMIERLERIPGVARAAFSLYAPMSGDNWSSGIVIEGRAPSERVNTSWNRVSPGYFETVGTPLLRGRAFDGGDRPGSPLVALVSESFARRHFGDADPIGRRIGQSVPEIAIVGVVGDAKYQDGRRAPREMFFLPYLQETAESRTRAAATGIRIDRSHYPQAIELHLRSAVPQLERDVRRALAEVDRRITVRNVVSMSEQVARAFSMERLIARLTIAFGLVALTLACLGVYGVTTYTVSRRTREIGLRMAVGASASRVVATILRSALVHLAAGVLIGLPAAFVAGRLLQVRLFNVSPHDPLVVAGSLALLGLSAVLAALIPAGRAASMDPVRALRLE
jgi:predicted permease